NRRTFPQNGEFGRMCSLIGESRGGQNAGLLARTGTFLTVSKMGTLLVYCRADAHIRGLRAAKGSGAWPARENWDGLVLPPRWRRSRPCSCRFSARTRSAPLPLSPRPARGQG